MENVGIISPNDELELIRNEIEEELAMQNAAQGGGLPPGIDKSKMAQFNQVANNLDSKSFGAQQNDAPAIIQALQNIPKIKGEVFIDTTGSKLTLVLTEMKDKATILNRLPARIRGKDKLEFRPYDENKDGELQQVAGVEQQDQVGAGVPAGIPGAAR